MYILKKPGIFLLLAFFLLPGIAGASGQDSINDLIKNGGNVNLSGTYTLTGPIMLSSDLKLNGQNLTTITIPDNANWSVWVPLIKGVGLHDVTLEGIEFNVNSDGNYCIILDFKIRCFEKKTGNSFEYYRVSKMRINTIKVRGQNLIRVCFFVLSKNLANSGLIYLCLRLVKTYYPGSIKNREHKNTSKICAVIKKIRVFKNKHLILTSSFPEFFPIWILISF